MRLFMFGLSIIALSSCTIHSTPSTTAPPIVQSTQERIDNSPYANEAVKLDYIPMDDLTKEARIINESISQTNLPLEDNTESEVYDEMFVIKDQSGNPVGYFPYKIVTEDGYAYRGFSNEKGETIRVTTGNRALSLCIFQDLDRTDGYPDVIKEKTDIPCPRDSNK